MPEAFAVLFIFVVAVASYIAAKIMSADPANHSAQAELARLRQQRAWLEERLQQAWRENWEQDMRARLADDINDIEAQIAKASFDLKQAA